MTDQEEQGPVIRTIARALAILNAFDESKPELGVTELGQLTRLDKATVYRLLSALQQGGLIEQDRATSKYRLGFGLVQLAGQVLRRLDLPQIVRPHLQELAHHSQETVNLSVMTDDDKLINIDRVASPRRIRNVGWIGREMPLHAVSGGKVIMAYLPQDRLDRILSSRLESFTERTIVDPTKLQEALAEIRQAGYGLAEEELEAGLSAVAAPIWSHEGQVTAVISISGPSFRLPRQLLVALGMVTKKIADRISDQIGYTA